MNKWEKAVVLERMLSRNKYSVPIKSILKELDCSEATFHRICNFAKTVHGAPIVFNRRYGGYQYDSTDGNSFELPGFWLTKDEIEALLCLDHAIENIHEGYFSDLLEPVRKRFEPILRAQHTTMSALRKRIKIISIGNRECNKDIFKTIAAAVIGGKRLAIKHRALTKHVAQERTVSPQALVRYRDNWYLDVFCHLRNGPRTFAVDRIEAAAFAPGKFHQIPDEQMETFYADAYGIFTGRADKKAMIEFTGIAAREVSHEIWHPKQQGQWLGENKFRLTIPYGHSRELVMDILRWGDEAEVIDPKELRDAVKIMVKGMQKKYG